MPDPRRSPDASPVLSPPPPFVERRRELRRAADRQAAAETRFLAHSADLLASDADADARLAGVLRLIGECIDAERVAILGEFPDRRVAVTVTRIDDVAAADELAAWLDASGPRTRAARAASGPAPIVHLVAPDEDGDVSTPPSSTATPFRLLVPLPSDRAMLGFDLPAAPEPAILAERLPPALLRHAAAILAVVSRDAATERELATLRAGEAERSRYVSTVAHELRTPLTGLAGYLDLILDGKVDDPAVEREFLERGRGIVGSLGALVGDLLELSRLDAGSLALDRAPFSMAEVGTRVVDALGAIALERGVELSADLPPRMRMAVADRRRVEQILTNLVGNALKFSPAGGDIRVAAWTDGPVALFAVRDDGAGIDDDDRDRIFERFYRMAGHEGVTGTGLGLPIARDLARAMGGDLAVASVPSAGSAFLLVLPGPAGATADDVAATLARLIPIEEQALEERAVLRTLDALGRQPTQSAPLTLREATPVGATGTTQAARSRARTGRRPRLRALDGGVRAPSIRPTPA
jgi:signal transduction histidine kinase